MADMIIKPSSGNSLVFQDEGGDPALTVGTTGNTTLAGTANNLGTITSATTFPAGHILQMLNVHSIAAQTVAGNSSATVTGCTKTFNRIRGNSHFICQANIVAASTSDQANLDDVDPSFAFVVNSTVFNTNTNLAWDGFYSSYVPAWRQGTSVTYTGGYDTWQIYCSQDMTHISSGSD